MLRTPHSPAYNFEYKRIRILSLNPQKQGAYITDLELVFSSVAYIDVYKRPDQSRRESNTRARAREALLWVRDCALICNALMCGVIEYPQTSAMSLGQEC